MSIGRYTKRSQVAYTVAKALREFGYPDCTEAMVRAALDAFIEGKREEELPHGVIGRFAGRQFEEVEQARPGVLASLAAE